MAEIHKRATISAPIDQVFDIVDDPTTFPKYVPNVHEVVDVQRSAARIGDTFRVIYKVLGVTFDEKFTVEEYRRPTAVTSKVEGGMHGTFSWAFEQLGNETGITIDVVYELAGGPLGKAIDSLMLQRVNEKTIEDTLKNLARLVAQETSPVS